MTERRSCGEDSDRASTEVLTVEVTEKADTDADRQTATTKPRRSILLKSVRGRKIPLHSESAAPGKSTPA